MTILGKHTITETRELITNVQYRVNDVSRTFDSLTDSQLASDSTLKEDWAKWLASWKTQRATAEDMLRGFKLASPLVSEDNIPAESAFEKILKTVNSNYPDRYSDKDLPGLQIRIQKIKPIDWKEVDKSRTDAPDADLKAFQKVDATIKSGEQQAKDFVKDNWGKIALGVIGAFGLAVLYKKL